MESLIVGANTSTWYKTNYGCIRTDPTMISRLHTFPDAMIPRGTPDTAAPPARVCSDTICGSAVTVDAVGCTLYRTAWPAHVVDPEPMIQTEMNHPQFAFRVGGPGTVYQIGVESQLRRLDQPLTNCQAVIPEDAPLYRNTVAPPPVSRIDAGVQNAANPIVVMIRPDDPASLCRKAADTVASALSDRRFNNPTRQDTMRIGVPVAPPGIGTDMGRVGFGVPK